MLLIDLAPIFSAGALVMTIDPLSMFFWMAALYTVWLALERSPEYSGWWPATGALIGLGFLSKYTNAMELLSDSVAARLHSEIPERTPPSRVLPHAGGFRGLYLAAADLECPARLDHPASSDHGAVWTRPKPGESRFSVLEVLTFLAEHFGVYSPVIFGGLVASIYWGWNRAANHFKPRFLLAFAVPLLTLYFTISWKHAGEPNWTAPAMISLSILAVAQWHELLRSTEWARRYTLAALALGGLASLCIVDMEMLRRIGIPWPYTLDPTERLRGWRTAAETIGAARREFEAAEGRPVFLIAKKYGTASSLAFYLPPAPSKVPAILPCTCRSRRCLRTSITSGRGMTKTSPSRPRPSPRTTTIRKKAGRAPSWGAPRFTSPTAARSALLRRSSGDLSVSR